MDRIFRPCFGGPPISSTRFCVGQSRLTSRSSSRLNSISSSTSPPPTPVIYIAPTAPPPDTSAATLARWDGAHPQARRAMKTAAMIFALALVGSQALAQEQTRVYGPDGRSLG